MDRESNELFGDYRENLKRSTRKASKSSMRSKAPESLSAMKIFPRNRHLTQGNRWADDSEEDEPGPHRPVETKMSRREISERSQSRLGSISGPSRLNTGTLRRKTPSIEPEKSKPSTRFAQPDLPRKLNQNFGRPRVRPVVRRSTTPDTFQCKSANEIIAAGKRGNNLIGGQEVLRLPSGSFFGPVHRYRNGPTPSGPLEETIDIFDETGSLEFTMFTNDARTDHRPRRMYLAKQYQETGQRFYLDEEDSIDFVWQRSDDEDELEELSKMHGKTLVDRAAPGRSGSLHSGSPSDIDARPLSVPLNINNWSSLVNFFLYDEVC